MEYWTISVNLIQQYEVNDRRPLCCKILLLKKIMTYLMNKPGLISCQQSRLYETG